MVLFKKNYFSRSMMKGIIKVIVMVLVKGK